MNRPEAVDNPLFWRARRARILYAMRWLADPSWDDVRVAVAIVDYELRKRGGKVLGFE